MTEGSGMPKRNKQSASIRRGRSNEPYSVEYFASKHDISRDQARELMRRIGRDREKLNKAAAKIFRK